MWMDITFCSDIKHENTLTFNLIWVGISLVCVCKMIDNCVNIPVNG